MVAPDVLEYPMVKEASPSRGIQLCCATCGANLTFGESGSAACGHGALRLADRFICSTSGDIDAAEAILAWPAPLLHTLGSWASGELTDTPPPTPELVEHALVLPAGGLTPLGEDVRYHMLEYGWQARRKVLDGLSSVAERGPQARVLDVGCGAAQTLRLLQAPPSATLVGVDQDVAALALGYRLSEAAGIEVTLARASAYRLPFHDATFDLVMTRVALNYMRQKDALAEMIRVLRPGGQLFCRVEGLRHDLKGLVDVRSIRGLLCRSRDLGYGVIHALLGWQPLPGSLLTGGRAFSTSGRLSRILGELGCDVLAKAATGPVAMGGHTQLALLARRDSSSPPPTFEAPAE